MAYISSLTRYIPNYGSSATRGISVSMIRRPSLGSSRFLSLALVTLTGCYMAARQARVSLEEDPVLKDAPRAETKALSVQLAKPAIQHVSSVPPEIVPDFDAALARAFRNAGNTVVRD